METLVEPKCNLLRNQLYIHDFQNHYRCLSPRFRWNTETNALLVPTASQLKHASIVLFLLAFTHQDPRLSPVATPKIYAYSFLTALVPGPSASSTNREG
jgi:hypothetical protein